MKMYCRPAPRRSPVQWFSDLREQAQNMAANFRNHRNAGHGVPGSLRAAWRIANPNVRVIDMRKEKK